MIDRFEAEDPHDVRYATSARPGSLLHAFNRAGVLVAADVHVAQRGCALVGETDESVALALALLTRTVRLGSVCLDLAELVASDDTLPWPEPSDWLARVSSSSLVNSSVLQVDGPRLYLDRYWREEGQVREDLVRRCLPHAERSGAPLADHSALVASAARLFPGTDYAEQHDAVLTAATQLTTVLTGGPGTGKTTTVAGLLAVLSEQAELAGRPFRVALTAPTGKAAARMQEAVRAGVRPPDDGPDRFTDADRRRLAAVTSSSTLHRLLGWRPESRTRFKHHRGNKLPHDVVVVDETSMVSLTMMARLLEAVRPEARLVLVGDPDQLASVEAGAVLFDVVEGLASRAPSAVAPLRTTHRFGRRIGDLAAAVRDNRGPEVLELLREGGPELELVDREDAAATETLQQRLLEHAADIRAAAMTGSARTTLAAMDRHRLLCAHREGPYGVRHWNAVVERLLAERTGEAIGSRWGPQWYVGRPLIITTNDYGLNLFNGDTGVVLRDPTADSGVRVAVAGHDKAFATSRLADVETLHAMTVHKSQGSQAKEVTVLLPPEDSPLLTRELLYTAVTRAEDRVCVVGTDAAVLAAVARPAGRATGLRDRFRHADAR